ncbi:hypothetical protein [Celeribacter neptunius]|uniref:Uncharacterized protein n=1 Tax=Celeribacter neptunius TaxID=588602 RepID=A0A1I3XTS8_9RHOB|nr:hypothetical protein [Celeribacter neptunius]SFK22934.1 hypothetical protein SAMN04487991_4150 [Celeribacter neptunius]
MPESELLTVPGIAILLAEPGAGKTKLLDSVAERGGAVRVRASAFRAEQGNTTLIVDAFDEVARIGGGRVFDILHRIRDAEPDRLLLSSRSGEWEDAKTRLVGDLFGVDPIVAHLVPLDSGEQRLLFEHLHPDSSFEAFHDDICRFDLHHLLGNPEFLRLFAGAYVEANGRLPSRAHVFTLAMEHLAREVNPNVGAAGAPTRHKRIAWANEVYAKLLLSGADGVAVGDIAEDGLHPQLETIGLDGDGPSSIFATKLFRPGMLPNQHEPVHRIVAEYGAAQHLVSRIDDPACRFTMAQSLALIAPNGVVRDDLRGLLGWIAAIGSQAIQDMAINLDAYAVLSNGDPSRLTVTSRIRLLDALAELNNDDPYFRRSDRWRTFQASGFFTQDIIPALRPLLVAPDDGHLRELLLELLIGAPAATGLRSELEAILFDDETNFRTRREALSCLLNDSEFVTTDALQRLVALGNSDALRLASVILEHLGSGAPFEYLHATLDAAVALYPTDRRSRQSRNFEERYFLKPLIGQIDKETCIRLLNDMTSRLRCTCGQERHECYCRDGVSKIAGMLLDRYFEQVSGPYNPDQIWTWVRNLHFHGRMSAKQSQAVDVLQRNDVLRRALHERAFAGMRSQDDIFNVLFDLLGDYGHSGLQEREGDARHLVDLAFREDNIGLWIQFAPSHRYFGDTAVRGSDALRCHCREQALEKPAFMREWARMNRVRKAVWREQRPRRYRFETRRRRRERRISAANLALFHANRAAIESGADVQWTYDLARAYLIQPDKLPEVTYDLFDAEDTLRQSLVTLGGRCPSIEAVGKDDARDWVRIFVAGAVAEFRATGTLEAVAPEILRAILPDTGGYKTFAEGEHQAFHKEVQCRAQLIHDECEAYARAYIEPSLEAMNGWPDPHILQREPALHHLRATLPLEWLRRFPELSIRTLETLFDMAAGFGDRDGLLELIRERCMALDEGMLPHKDEKQRQFWFMRNFWFADEIDSSVWAYMTRDPDIVFWLERRRESGREGDEIWSVLSAPKIERILLAYLPHWPVVPLPSSWGTGSPRGETAYRYLRNLVWRIGRDEAAVALPVIGRLLGEAILAPAHNDLRSIRAELRRRSAMTASRPNPAETAAFMDVGLPASVEQMRALVLELFQEFQKDIRAGHTGLRDPFYDGDTRLNEVRGMARVAAWMKPRLSPFDIHDVVEHQLEERNRCDLTATRMVNGVPRMLVIEGKGQWHRDLFGAAVTQLAERYAMHPDAGEQGIFLVLWYGPDETVAGSVGHAFQSALELQSAIEMELPAVLRGRVDVFVLDVSRPIVTAA